MDDKLRDALQESLGEGFAIERELAGGGMSRIFLASDIRLERRIVIKTLPAEMAQAVSIERFRREIRLAARLSHPHIVPLLVAGESSGIPYYTMPLVSGESLRTRLNALGPLSIPETIHVLRDIAEALGYAHGEGVVHRDIKPENVIMSGGVAVVTDFGVSKAIDLAATDAGAPSTQLTASGVALGTPAYMSPEQAVADPGLDHRSDIYSFGCVAYEMLAGTSPFAGRPAAQLLGAHVSETPSAIERPDVPAALTDLVMRCLAKRPDQRPQNAAELLALIDTIPAGGATTERPARAASGRDRRTFALAALALSVIILARWELVRREEAAFRMEQPRAIASSAQIEADPALSPDGKFIAYSLGPPGQQRVYVVQVAGGNPVPLTADLDGSHTEPAWSHDGARILFLANGAAYVVPALGGPARLLVRADSGRVLSPQWSPDGSMIAYSDVRGIQVRAAESGPARTIVHDGPLHSLSWSPDGQRLAYIKGYPSVGGNTTPAAIWTVDLKTGHRTQIAPASSVNTSPVWHPDGRRLYFASNRDGAPDVFEQRLRRNGDVLGPPRRITTGLFVRKISFSSDASRMAYSVIRERSAIWIAALPASDSEPPILERQLTNENERIEIIQPSHDGKWIAFDSDRNGNFDVFKIRIDEPGASRVQLTTNLADDFQPAWSPDDREIAFHTFQQGTRDIRVMNADGSGAEDASTGPRQDRVPNWSADGRHLLFYAVPDTRTNTMYVVQRGSDGRWMTPSILKSSVRHPRQPRWSPVGMEIAVVDGINELVVISADGAKSRILIPGAPGDSIELVRWTEAGTIHFTTVTNDASYAALWAIPSHGGRPTRLFRVDRRRNPWRSYQLDGSRLFVRVDTHESDVWVVETQK